MVWVSGKSGSRGSGVLCHSGLGYMTMVMCSGLIEALYLPQCIACCSWSFVVGCASPLPDHCVEKAGPSESKILSLVKGEKKSLMGIGHVIGDEKYECVREKVVMRWLRSGGGNVY